jgi:hypothetical protein
MDVGGHAETLVSIKRTTRSHISFLSIFFLNQGMLKEFLDATSAALRLEDQTLVRTLSTKSEQQEENVRPNLTSFCVLQG